MQIIAPFSWSWLVNDGATFFTALLAVIAILQAALFIWQLVYMRRAMEHSTVAARAAQESARVAREAFNKMERPYIYIFGVKGPLSENEALGRFDYIEYYVANYGKTPAKIEDVCFSIGIGKEPSEPAPAGAWHELRRRPILVPNERRDKLTQSHPSGIPTRQYADEETPPGEQMEPITQEGEHFFFSARIKYRGPFSEGHETSACWTWDKKSARLVEYGGGECNYTR